MKKIQEAHLENKKVLVRVDFNVSFAGEKVKETFKIKAAKETLDYLLAQNSSVALISHLGRPEGKFQPEFSLRRLALEAEKILGIKINFVEDCLGLKVTESLTKLRSSEIILLENVRFYPGDEENNPQFSRELASGFEVFVNDAFSASHRDHASVTGVAKFLPSFAGLRLQKEIAEMEKIKTGFKRPAVAIIGGAKIETKLPILKFFEKNYDYVLVGGKIANEALDQKIIFNEKVFLPVDFIDNRLDLGPKTVEKFKEIIKQSQTLVWNGPLGKFEEEKYARATQEIFSVILASSAYKVAGGGETLEILEKEQALNKFSFVSTGGGAMLEYLGGKKMPGIEILS